MVRGHEHVGDLGELGELPRAVAVVLLEHAQRLEGHQLRLADHDGVDDRRQRQRVREGERTAGEDERIALGIVLPRDARRGDVRRLEQRDQPGHLQLVGHAHRDHRERVERLERLVGERARLQQRRAVGLVVEEHALAGQLRRLHDRAVDALETERAHSRGIGRRVGERDREGRLLADATDLLAEPIADASAHGLATDGAGIPRPERVHRIRHVAHAIAGGRQTARNASAVREGRDTMPRSVSSSVGTKLHRNSSCLSRHIPVSTLLFVCRRPGETP